MVEVRCIFNLYLIPKLTGDLLTRWLRRWWRRWLLIAPPSVAILSKPYSSLVHYISTTPHCTNTHALRRFPRSHMFHCIYYLCLRNIHFHSSYLNTLIKSCYYLIFSLLFSLGQASRLLSVMQQQHH